MLFNTAMAVRGEEGGDESVYVWPENSCMIRVIKEPALSTDGEIQVGEKEPLEREKGAGQPGSTHEVMRFEDTLVSNPKEEICAADIQPCEPGCLLVNMVISPCDTSDVAMKDPMKVPSSCYRCIGALGTDWTHGR